jgi:hypothetical protein
MQAPSSRFVAAVVLPVLTASLVHSQNVTFGFVARGSYAASKGTCDLPVRFQDCLLDALIGGWSLNAIASLWSGFPFPSVDLGLFKRFAINETVGATLRFEAFNAFNRVNPARTGNRTEQREFYANYGSGGPVDPPVRTKADLLKL